MTGVLERVVMSPDGGYVGTPLAPGEPLSARVRVQVTSRVVGAAGILAVARDPKAAAKLIRATCGGSLDGGGLFWADGPGAWVGVDTLATMRGSRRPDLTWADMVKLTAAGLSPGAVAGLSWAFRRYQVLHEDRCQRCGGKLKWLCGHQINAVSDPLAYRLWWWPEYVETTSLMTTAANQVWDQALVALTTNQPPAQLALAL